MKSRKTSKPQARNQRLKPARKAAEAATKPFPIVGIGASAGGLEAFTQLLKHLPTDTGMVFVLVQHLDPVHESALTQLLKRATSLPVREVTNNLPVEPDNVYVIPPNSNLAIEQGLLKLEPRKGGRAPHLSIDSFFESLAHDQRERAIGIILSGTASDGTLGLEAIKAEGGITFAQDDSAKYDSMPRSAIAAGCVDFVLSPEKIAKELARIARHPYVAGPLTPALSPAEAERQKEERASKVKENGFKKILGLVHNHSGVDFSLYKPGTIERRIARRMMLNKIDKADAYANFLRAKPKELEALYSDMLINVTSFFRNPAAFRRCSGGRSYAGSAARALNLCFATFQEHQEEVQIDRRRCCAGPARRVRHRLGPRQRRSAARLGDAAIRGAASRGRPQSGRRRGQLRQPRGRATPLRPQRPPVRQPIEPDADLRRSLRL